MFEPVMFHEPGRITRDRATALQMVAPLRTFIFTYVDQVVRRLAAEFGGEREGWVGDPADPFWHDPDSVEVVHEFIRR
jgi:hypothetical protein